jgi:hypothetical protein
MSDARPELRLVRAGGAGETRATLDLISTARRSLAEARDLPDYRRVMEMAAVAKDAAQRAARLAEAERLVTDVVASANEAANDAAAVRMEAQAKAGELLREMTEQGTRAVGRPEKVSRPSTLSDLGVSRNESSLWQQVAAVPPEVRTGYIDETRAARGEVSTAGLLRYAADVQATPDDRGVGPGDGRVLVWVRQQGGGRHTWRAGDPPHWCIEEPPEGRRKKAEAEAHRRWLDDEHPDRAGDWELWYSTPSKWVCLGFHPSLEAAQTAGQEIAGDRDRMAELDSGRDRRRDHAEAIAAAQGARASRSAAVDRSAMFSANKQAARDTRQRLADELHKILIALPTYAPAVIAQLEGDERKGFHRTARRVARWFRDVMAELRRNEIASQGSDSVEIGNVYVTLHDLHTLCAGPAGVGAEALVGAVEEDERPELLAAVRAMNDWLADLEGELIRQGVVDELTDDKVPEQQQ